MIPINNDFFGVIYIKRWNIKKYMAIFGIKFVAFNRN